MNSKEFYREFGRLELDIKELGQQMIEGGEGLEGQLADRIFMLAIRTALEYPEISQEKFYFVEKINKSGVEITASDKHSMQKLCYGCRTYYPVIAGNIEKEYGDAFIMCSQDGIQIVKRLGRNYQKENR